LKASFDAAMSEEWTHRALAHVVYGGADFCECTTIAGRIIEGDGDSWYREWTETADRVSALAEASAAKGHKVNAREAYLHASNHYRTSYPLLYSAPVDPRRQGPDPQRPGGHLGGLRTPIRKVRAMFWLSTKRQSRTEI
jgi:hypothetical protein